MRNLFSILLFTFIFVQANAQSSTQTVKGQIIDKQSEIPIIGASIEWLNENETKGAVSDYDGYFTLEEIPVGRQVFRISYLGYETMTLPNVELTTGKEVFLNLSMVESVEVLEEIVVRANVPKDRAINEYTTISGRTFSLEEVNRYAGGRSDIARLAGNFAGVATADDSRNDIVVRGNSPSGLLWRLEGIPIPNPNHFSTLGSTGGPVSAMNPNILKNSDFLTGAFPSEYGNASSGVFDLGMRTGNRDKHEFTFQIAAFSGLEAMAEGPLGKKGGSYLVALRNSFIVLISPPQTNATPNYTDLSFKIDSPNGKAGKISLFGIGGRSNIDFIGEDIEEGDLFSDKGEDLYVISKFGVVGLKHNIIIDNQSYIRSVIASSYAYNKFELDRYYNIDTPEEQKARLAEGQDAIANYSFSSLYNRKINAKSSFRTGILIESKAYDLYNRDATFGPDPNEDGINDLLQIYEFDGRATEIQPYIQFQHKFSKKWQINFGVHGLYNKINNQFVLEPRGSLAYHINDKQKLTFGYGLHSQSQALPILLAETNDEFGKKILRNINLDFFRSQHYVLAYDYAFAKNWRAKIEAYYQNIDRAAVDAFSSQFSLLNLGADFGFPSGKTNLTNDGTGNNQGIELTIEKFFSKGFHCLLTTSIFDSKYVASDGIERNTPFNNKFVVNVLTGKEFKIGDHNAITIDGKLTSAGGRYYTPIDLEASKLNNFEVRDELLAYTEQYDDYFRLDLKLGFKMNSKKRKISQQIFVDFANVTNRKNIFSIDYDRTTQQLNEKLQSGFFPDFLYRIQF